MKSPFDMPPLPAALQARDVSVRPIADDDGPLVARWHAEFRGASFLAMGWPREQVTAMMADQLRLQQIHIAGAYPRADRWLVLASEVPAGQLLLDRAHADWRLIDLLLAPEARGLGLGSGLMAWIKEAATQAHAASITLDVGFDNAPAQALYRKAGFVEAPSETEIAVAMRWRPG
ncbi:GNAT family N-acetyltransferase [Caulobacter endophyticus]|uniref:GNAT family N-acetyltransferase n=1 Tax=Caulobacter endophyticus TaxID=2172652 RepID=UPI002410B05C|nr:GNAT family N-acetyltransferase [Caulobacter endophyticus]MDG2531789.1 GNAT family N-acetyltransferase [Caulobacter endophyticus]